MEKGDGKMIIGMREGAKRDGVRDQRIAKVVELVAPEKLLEELSLGTEHAKAVVKAREEVVNVLHGKDSRLMVVVGPCSVHDPQAALDYARRLAAVNKELSDRLLIVMRVYFEKPRTTTGWKGLINDPHLDGSGLSMPIGFKNRTDGNIQVAVDAVRAAAVPHAFAGIDDAGAPAILHTTGNPDGHVILRGGKGGTNFDAAAVSDAL